MDLYPGDPGDPGLDCAGTVVEVGSSVTDLKPGDDVFGIALGCLQTYATTDRRLLARQENGWAFTAAAALPTVYTTVDYAFSELAKLQKGERVLIHAATGGVGLVAVQYAQRLGAKVFTTAGKEEKHAHLRERRSVSGCVNAAMHKRAEHTHLKNHQQSIYSLRISLNCYKK